MILSSILIKPFKPIIRYFIVKRYKGIWGLKKYIKDNNITTNISLDVYNEFFAKYGSWIGSHCTLKGIPCFPHDYYGIFISGGSIIGKNVVILQQVTIGSNTLSDSKSNGCPTIGNNVYIGAGAKIIGKVVVGDNCRIGANSVVTKDMPSNTVAISSPTRYIQKSDLDNRFFGGYKGKLAYYDNGNWVEVENKSH